MSLGGGGGGSGGGGCCSMSITLRFVAAFLMTLKARPVTMAYRSVPTTAIVKIHARVRLPLRSVRWA